MSASQMQNAPVRSRHIWRYTAVELHGKSRRRRVGELAGASASEVRASLRRIGLQVIDIRPLTLTAPTSGAQSRLRSVASALRSRLHEHLRVRRRGQRAELFDGLATMLDTGVPLLEALDTLMPSHRALRRFGAGGAVRIMLSSVREQLRGGASLDEAMAEQPGWFDATEVAMIRAAQHAGNLPPVLRRLAQQHERAGELGHKLSSALAYPLIIALVGIGVVIFLSMKTLPDLARVLESAGLDVPALTKQVMSAGQMIWRWWWLLLGSVAGFMMILITAPSLVSRFSSSVGSGGSGASGGSGGRRRRVEFTPMVIRRMAVAGFSLRLAELLRSGVPVVEALRVLVPTANSASFRSLLSSAAERVERGEELAAALDDERWFSSEYRRLIEIGQASGELDALLERIGHRYERSAKRLIDRLAALLEPCVILALAALIGIVAMAAVLPLTRLQEVLR